MMTTKRKFFVSGPHSRKIGVLASTFDDLLKKCEAKLLNGHHMLITLEDGTEIDEEFFEILEDGTELCARSAENRSHFTPLFKKLEEFVYQYADLYMKAGNRLEDLLEGSESCSITEIMNKFMLMKTVSVNDDSEWFKGLDTKFKTKEAVMRNSSETRMRGYLQKAKKDLGMNNKKHQVVLSYLQTQLKLNKFHAFYFDRTDKTQQKLCSDQGEFRCFGKYDEDSCMSDHSINPYVSREERIIFSTWNFDHVLEKSRTVIPMIEAILQTHSVEEINLQYIYELLFSHVDISKKNFNGNLKLVHIVCHDKAPHKGTCNRKRLLSL